MSRPEDTPRTPAQTVADALAAAPGVRSTITDPDTELPPLLQQWAQRTQRASMCPHLSADAVLLGLLSDPGHVWCRDCVDAMMRARHDLDGFVCDGCGNPHAGLVTWRATPTLLVLGGLCRDCAGPVATPTQTPDTAHHPNHDEETPS